MAQIADECSLEEPRHARCAELHALCSCVLSLDERARHALLMAEDGKATELACAALAVAEGSPAAPQGGCSEILPRAEGGRGPPAGHAALRPSAGQAPQLDLSRLESPAGRPTTTAATLAPPRMDDARASGVRAPPQALGTASNARATTTPSRPWTPRHGRC